MQISFSKIKKALFVTTFLLCPYLILAQSLTVTGTVKDTGGESLIGVSVVVKETKQGTTCNIHGKYTITAKKGQHLIFNFIGMQPTTVKVTKETINVVLKEDTKELEQVVINGYQRIQSRVFTGAANSVKMDDVKLEGITDISRMLEGRVAGLSIQNVTGTFGAAPRINIRGGASIVGNVQPLWVIDGAVYEDLVSLSMDQLLSGDAVTLISSAVAGLNASDIEDIQILKDASATSVYGARALNGVIVVTTKSPHRNTPNKISYDYELTFRDIPNYANYDLLNSQETMAIYQELEDKGYFNLKNTLYGQRSGIFYQWYKNVSTINPLTGTYYNENTEAAKMAFMKEREYANTDWFKYLFQNRPAQSHTLSFSSGGKNATTYASIGLYTDGGWTIADRLQRVTANLKSSFYINNKFKTTLSAQGNMRKQKAPGTFSQRKNISIGDFERDFDINPFAYALGTSRTLRPTDKDGNLEYYRNNWAPFNIRNEYNNNYMEIDVLDFKVQADATYKITKDLEANMILSVRQAQTQNSHYIKEESNVIRAFRANETPFVAQNNIYLYKDKDAPELEPQIALTHGGILNKTETSLKSCMTRFALDYNKQIGEHNIKAFTFSEIRYADRVVNPFSGYGLQYKRGNQVFTNPLIFEKMTNEGENYFSLQNYYDRGVTFSLSGTYGYAGKYILNGILNYEGSNTAGKNSPSRWLPTWNVGGKWNIDREDFMQESLFSKLAIRSSFGLTAKMNEQAIHSNAVFKNMIINRTRFEERENALRIYNLENRDLTWEKMYELNVGVDAGFFNNRVSTTMDIYQRNSFDLIDLVRTSGVGGQYYKYANFGNMRTRGIEFTIKTKNIQSKNFNWISFITFSFMDQRITKLRNSPNTFDMVAGRGRGNIEGYPRGSLFSFNFQGLNHLGLPTFDFGLYPLDNREYPEISGADFLDTQFSKSYLIYHGSIEPNIISGLSNTLSYKGLELSFFITTQMGNKIRLNPTFDPAFGDLNVFSREHYDRWLNPYDEWKTNVPALPSQELIQLIGRENIEKAYNTYNFCQNRVVDGGFIRMKSIALSYQISKFHLEKVGIKSLRVKTQVTNPFLIYADKRLNGQDPEFYKSGGVALPISKQWTISLGIGF